MPLPYDYSLPFVSPMDDVMPDLQLAFSLAQCATIFVQNPTIIFSTHLSFDSRTDFNNALVICCKNYLCIFTNFVPPR